MSMQITKHSDGSQLFLFKSDSQAWTVYVWSYEMEWNTSDVSCCFNYSLILSYISTYIFVELETKPFISIPPVVIFILPCDF